LRRDQISSFLLSRLQNGSRICEEMVDVSVDETCDDVRRERLVARVIGSESDKLYL
jgi:hypothetical protein